MAGDRADGRRPRSAARSPGGPSGSRHPRRSHPRHGVQLDRSRKPRLRWAFVRNSPRPPRGGRHRAPSSPSPSGLALRCSSAAPSRPAWTAAHARAGTSGDRAPSVAQDPAAADDRRGRLRRVPALVAAWRGRPDRRRALSRPSPGWLARRTGTAARPPFTTAPPTPSRRCSTAASRARASSRTCTRTPRTCSRCSRTATSCTSRRRPPGSVPRACARRPRQPPRATCRTGRSRATAASSPACATTERPALWFKHVLLPHVPWMYYPSGTRYRRHSPEPITDLNGRSGFSVPWVDEGRLPAPPDPGRARGPAARRAARAPAPPGPLRRRARGGRRGSRHRLPRPASCGAP